MKRLMIKEIEADAKQYGDDRRTLIQQEKRATFEAKVVDEPVTVIVSQKGWVRARRATGSTRPASRSRPATACTRRSSAARPIG
jgi:DNA gyrase/topoisomerase IV subunit A